MTISIMEIKQYKPLALVFYIDGNGCRSALPLEDSQRQDFKNEIEKSKMIELDGIVINTYDIKEIRPAALTTELEKYFYSKSWQERGILMQKAREQSRNPKMHPIEWYGELGTNRAIEKMESVLRSKLNPQVSVPKTPVKPLTAEQKARIEAQKKLIREHFTK